MLVVHCLFLFLSLICLRRHVCCVCRISVGDVVVGVVSLGVVVLVAGGDLG